MKDVSIGQLKDKADSLYRLVILAAKRAKQLRQGEKPLVGSEPARPTDIALKEIARGVITYSNGVVEKKEEVVEENEGEG